MPKKIVDITFQENINFDGKLNNDSYEVSIENVKIGIKKYHYLEDMKFNAHFQPSERATLRKILHENSGRFNIKGNLYGHVPINAKANWSNLEESLISGVVTELQIACKYLENKPGRQYLYAYLTPTNLSLPEIKDLVFHWTGEIKSMEWGGLEKQEPFVFNTALGEAKLALHYDFESTESDDLNLDVRIPRTVISIEIVKELCDKNVESVIAKFKKDLKDIEIILSFFSRRQVRWYEIELLSDKFEDEKGVEHTRIIKKGFSTPEPFDEFVNPHCFTNKLNICNVVENFKNSVYKEPIEHAVNYLNGMWDDRAVESIITTSFTAFETVINGVSNIDGNFNIINDDDFKVLRKKIESTIKGHCKNHDMDGSVRSEFYRKLPEVQRSAIVPRAIKILKKYNVYCLDILKNEYGLEEWLNKAYTQRSTLIHAGRVDDLYGLGRNAYRIHALTERLIYELIGGKKDWLSPTAYRYIM